MTQKKPETLKKELKQLREEIIKVIKSQDEDTDSRNSADEVDKATDMIEDIMGAAVSTNYKDNLRKVDEALKRIDAGVYGLCENCEEKIAPARLKVLPFALYCIQCKQEMEREELS